VQGFAEWNPMAWVVARLRELVLFGEVNLGWTALFISLFIAVLAFLALRFFRRLEGHFEDFL
jgi:ABC-type polysaccharide/polyol phosphate export permease